MSDEPSIQGLLRYPETAGYNVELVHPIPCTCRDECAPRCAGECGCEACSVQFSTFCSVAGFIDAAPGSTYEELALEAYRAVNTAHR